MKGPFQFRKGRQAGGGVVKDVCEVKICHIDDRGTIHTIGAETPDCEVYWLLQVEAALKNEDTRPFIRIVTDLNMWWPVTSRDRSAKNQNRFLAYFDVYESDNAYILLRMDARDKRFIAASICKKLNL